MHGHNHPDRDSRLELDLEVGRDLHEYGGLKGKLLTVAEAEALSGALINGE